MNAPVIYQLSIERFRGIKALAWRPARGVNIVLGGGDVGKTTILEAIALLLSPTYPTTLADSDYNGRNIEAGFVIEAVFSLPSSSAINEQAKSYWPWDWNGKEVVVPTWGEHLGSDFHIMTVCPSRSHIPQKLARDFCFWILKENRSRYHAGSSIPQTLYAEFCRLVIRR
jgi:hypothetical protein